MRTDPDVRGVCHFVDLDQLSQPSTPADVRLQDRVQTTFNQPLKTGRRKLVLATSNRDVRFSGQYGITCLVSDRQWFFEPAQMEWFDRRQACLEPFMAPG